MKTQERKEREAAALRANLLRRKEQMRRRSESETAGSEAPAKEVENQAESDKQLEE
jgi:hypothetical protein